MLVIIMDKIKLLLALYIASLLSAAVIGYKDIHAEVVDVLNKTGVFKTLDEHEKRIALLEEKFEQFRKGIIEMEDEQLIMKLAKRLGEPVTVKNITCYPKDNVCIIVEK